MPTRMIIILLVVLSQLTANAQETAWKRNLDAGRKATWQDRDEAEKLLLRALKEAETFSEQDHRLAQSLQALGNLYRLEKKYEEAEPLLQQAVAITEKGLGLEHRSVAAQLSTLAFLYSDQGQYAEAEPLFLRAVTIMEKAGRPEDAFLAISLQNYAGLLRKTDRNAEAEKLEERAKAIWDNQQWGRPQRDR